MWCLTEDEWVSFKKSANIKNVTEQKFSDACKIFGKTTGYGFFSWPHPKTRGTPFLFGVGYAELNPVIYGTSIDVQTYCQCQQLIAQCGRDWAKVKKTLSTL